MKLIALALPIVLTAAYVGLRRGMGRPLSRPALRVVVALLLLCYVLGTAGLGLFWVARQDLPPFDLHYLSGYCLLFVVAIHVVLEFPIVRGVFRRRRQAQAKEPVREAPVRGVPSPTTAVLLACAGLVVGFWAGRLTAPRSLVISSERSRLWIDVAGERIPAAEYCHRESSYAASGATRSVTPLQARPPVFREQGPFQPLPRPRDLAGRGPDAAASPQSRASMSLDELSDLLHYAMGVTAERGGLSLRAAASAGALYPTDGLVLARRVEGLDAGLYYYHPGRHALARMGGAEVLEEVADALAEPESMRQAPAALAFVAVYDRTVWKYSIRSYRYVTLDAGHILWNLALAASARNVSCAFLSRFDDRRLAKALRLQPADEGVLTLACLGVEQGEPSSKPRYAPPSIPDDFRTTELTRLSHLLTSWTLQPGGAGTDTSPAAAALQRNGLLALPGASRPEVDTFALIAARRSFREFTQREMRLEDLAGMLAQLPPWARMRPNPSPRPGGWTGVSLVVRRVAGLAPGVYHHVPEQHALVPGPVGDYSSTVATAGLSQEVLARAGVIFVLTLDFDRIGLLDGERDYRYACLEAGMIGEAIYLEAGARGLGACGVGAFHDAEVDSILGLAGRKKALHLVAVGARD